MARSVKNKISDVRKSDSDRSHRDVVILDLFPIHLQPGVTRPTIIILLTFYGYFTASGTHGKLRFAKMIV